MDLLKSKRFSQFSYFLPMLYESFEIPKNLSNCSPLLHDYKNRVIDLMVFMRANPLQGPTPSNNPIKIIKSKHHIKKHTHIGNFMYMSLAHGHFRAQESLDFQSPPLPMPPPPPVVQSVFTSKSFPPWWGQIDYKPHWEGWVLKIKTI